MPYEAVPRALARFSGLIERGAESIAGAEERRGLLGLRAREAKQGLELGEKKGRLLDIQIGELEEQREFANEPVTFGHVFGGAGPLETVHNIEIIDDIQRMTGCKLNPKDGYFYKDGGVLTRRDFGRLAPAFQAAILSKKDLGKMFEDQAAQAEMMGMEDDAQTARERLASFQEDPAPFLSQQLGQLTELKGLMMGQGVDVDTSLIDQGIARVQGQIDAIQEGRAKKAEAEREFGRKKRLKYVEADIERELKEYEHTLDKKLETHKANLEAKEAKGKDMKVSDYKGVIQTILGFYKDTDSTFANLLMAIKNKDLTDTGMIEIAQTALDKLEAKAETDPTAKKHLAELQDAYTGMLNVAGITPRKIEKEEEPETMKMRFNPETMDLE